MTTPSRICPCCGWPDTETTKEPPDYLDHGQSIGFSQTWEDPRIDAMALDVQPTDTVVTITSGGCTPLSLLLAGPVRLVSVDSNAAQNRLAELKVAALRTLAPHQLEPFLGLDGPMDRLAAYVRLRPVLGTACREFWDARRDLVRSGVAHAGVADRFFYRAGAFLVQWIYGRDVVHRLFELKNLDEQRRFFDHHFDGVGAQLVDRLVVPLLGSRWALRLLFPSGFFRFITKRDIPERLQRRFRHVICNLPVRDNYFLSRIYFRRHLTSPEGRPPYLAPHAHARLAPLLDRLELVTAPLQEYLAGLPDHSVDKFQLSNVVEWMAPDDELPAFFRELVRVARPGARLFFRTAFTDHGVPDELQHRLVVDEAASARLLELDRSFIYDRCTLATVAAS